MYAIQKITTMKKYNATESFREYRLKLKNNKCILPSVMICYGCLQETEVKIEISLKRAVL